MPCVTALNTSWGMAPKGRDVITASLLSFDWAATGELLSPSVISTHQSITSIAPSILSGIGFSKLLMMSSRNCKLR
jgi:hypothetical protein